MLFFLLIGAFVVDADLAMQKKTEMKMLLELSNHHATFAVEPLLKTEGVIDLMEKESLDRFDKRMLENGGYRREGSQYFPGEHSVTTDAVPFARYYVDFLSWRHDHKLFLQHKGNELVLDQVVPGPARPTGGLLEITVTTKTGEELRMAPKTMVGPSHIVVAYVDERPFLPMLPAHAFPVVSVEELKW
ncbi:hypothetical protein NDK47_01135 [Brevibacillus ruminantium]|uniref:Uncharacterized protein n=1 Tax=Brevibacillus ruminantium TaxID=2950604 RepID=A0ABY4WMI2_9BACL|nr:hypothetical protein [Brevibacillus ruminantium]USG68302.1 hypothetical protein NDK47_01135 [Brevibacillus ruminantium]